MKKTKTTRCKARLLPLLSLTMMLHSTAVADIPVGGLTGGPEGSVLDDVYLFGNARLRYEYADVENLNEANVGSLRVRYGIKTDSFNGFKFLAEGESTLILTDKGNYSPFPGYLNNGRAVIGDPDNHELNRLQLSYNAEAIDTNITIGRQYITLADQHCIGSVGWRQNDQTFDAILLENKSLDDFAFTYAYIDQVNRIFGDQTPSGALDRWESESHLLHAEYTGIENHTVRAFAYLLDFENASANSSNTFGLELQGTRDLSDGTLNYLLTIATQSDAGNNTADYQEYYYRAQAGFQKDDYQFGLGTQVMCSDGSNSFRMPLGTNHKFNGFADAYLTPPSYGLINHYAWAGTKLFGFKHKLIVHNFHSESGSINLGWEVDYVASRKIVENTLFILKIAHLMGDGPQVDITRASAELNYSF